MSEAPALPPWPAIPFGSFPQFERAAGAYLYKADGQPVLDAGGQACASNIGYGRQEVADTAAQALKDFTHALPPFFTPQRERLVRTLTQAWLPAELNRIHLVNSGSEATDAAIRLARQYHLARGNGSRWKVIGRELSYHGVTLGALGVSGHAERRRGFEPLLSGLPLAPACYPLRCRQCSTDRTCTLGCADGLEALIEAEGPETIAAFIGEPIVGTSGGAIVPHDDYWRRVREICNRHGILLILDEVITGFGRTGRKFGFQHWDVAPDIMLLAKGFTGGYAPLAALVTTDRVVEPLIAGGDMIMFHTFGGHPAACAVASNVLEIIDREQLVERASVLGRYLGERLSRLREHEHVAEVRGRGLLWAVELVRDRSTLERFSEEADVTFSVIRRALEQGVMFYFGGTGEHRDIICIGPPFIIEHGEIDMLVDVLEHAINTVTSKAA